MPSKTTIMIKTASVVGILRAVMKLIAGPMRKDSSQAMISGRMTDWAVFNTTPTATITRMPRKINVILLLSNSIVNFFQSNRRVNFRPHYLKPAHWVNCKVPYVL